MTVDVVLTHPPRVTVSELRSQGPFPRPRPLHRSAGRVHYLKKTYKNGWHEDLMMEVIRLLRSEPEFHLAAIVVPTRGEVGLSGTRGMMKCCSSL